MTNHTKHIATISAAALLAVFPIATIPAKAAEHREETTNLIHFDMVDFVGWNDQDWGVMKKYHTADVAVDIMGQHTDGIDPHIAMMKKTLGSQPSMVVQHAPKVAQGDYTGVVGITNIPGFRMATIAKWRDGAIADEHLFTRELKPAELAALDLSKPTLSITTPDDQALRAATGAQAGWNVVVTGANPAYAVFSQTVDGKLTQQIGFAEQ